MLNDLKNINTETEEGKVIIALTAMLSCTGKYTKWTPNEILEEASKRAKDFK